MSCHARDVDDLDGHVYAYVDCAMKWGMHRVVVPTRTHVFVSEMVQCCSWLGVKARKSDFSAHSCCAMSTNRLVGTVMWPRTGVEDQCIEFIFRGGQKLQDVSVLLPSPRYLFFGGTCRHCVARTAVPWFGLNERVTAQPFCL